MAVFPGLVEAVSVLHCSNSLERLTLSKGIQVVSKFERASAFGPINGG